MEAHADKVAVNLVYCVTEQVGRKRRESTGTLMRGRGVANGAEALERVADDETKGGNDVLQGEGSGVLG